MPVTYQWTKSPPGASGSSTRSSSAVALEGTPDQVSGGETSSPWHEYFRGIGAPSAKAVLVSDSRTALTGGATVVFGAVVWDFPHAASPSKRRAAQRAIRASLSRAARRRW